MHDVVADAMSRLTSAKCPWAVVRGAGAAYVATAARLGWEVYDATEIRTDQGRRLSLIRVPPIVILRECDAAVRRWRWQRIETAFPDLLLNPSLSGLGAAMRPVWRILACKGPLPPDGTERTWVRCVR